jgi:putative hemolysin
MNLGEFLMIHGWRLAALVVLVACSAFFSASETALFSLSRADLVRFRQAGHPLGHVVAALMRDPRRLLMATLLGNQLVSVAFFSVAASLNLELAEESHAPGWVQVLLLLLPLAVLIMVGEVCPKSLAVSAPRTFARLSALPLSVLVRVLSPVQKGLDVVFITPMTRLLAPERTVAPDLTPDEMAGLLDLSGERGLISASESAWIQEVIGLSRLKVGDIMVPRVDMAAYDVDGPPAGLVELFRKTGRAKLPVYKGDLDDTPGVVHAKDLLLSPQTPLRRLIKPVPYVPETGTVDKLLQLFRHTRTQMAIVVDEYGGTAGLVSLVDAVEAIVGDISDPGEAAVDPVRQVGPGEYLVSGALPIHEWPDVFGVDLPVERVSTVGGLVMSLLDRLPKVGDVATYRGLQFTVESVSRRRIELVRLRLREGEA